ncbi:MAG: GIY-YIG nuclease family protein [Allomuricauda sp.]
MKAQYLPVRQAGFNWIPACRQAGNIRIKMAYFAYVLRSLIDGRLYKGHTKDVQKRLLEHNSGKTKSTKGFMPWELVYFEEIETSAEARKREQYFKTGIGREFIKIKLK